MDTSSAIALISELEYKPGWTFEAHDHTRRFEGSITVKIHYPALNSDRDQAAQGYPKPIMTYASFPLVVSECDEVSLAGQILRAIERIESHESREFLRLKPTWWAPFHPHNVDGIKRYADLAPLDTALMGDMQFGLA